MIQSLDVISVNLWQILISLVNLLIIYRILKRFLFKPVQEMLKKRQEQVDTLYSDARRDRETASGMKEAYEQKLSGAREEADGIVKEAVFRANRASEDIIGEANAKAAHIKTKTEQEIVQQKQQMLAEVKSEIGDIAISIASKVVEREISPKDHEALVDEFIRNVGDQP